MTLLHPIEVDRSDAARPKPVLSIESLDISYADGAARRQVLHGLTLDLHPGEVVALVGESGSGKTTTAQAVMGLMAKGARIDRGTIRLAGRDVTHLPDREFNRLRGRVVSLIPQDPGTSLNPLQTVGRQVGEILLLHGAVSRARLRERVVSLLERVGLPDPEQRFDQYPHELSGGMRQRVLIATAIALEPAVIVADEPTSALDVTVQKRILDLIDGLRRDFGTAILLVTHDLAVAADRADRIVVLKNGRVQEAAPARVLLAAPQSPYARQLLADAPALAAPATRPARAGGSPIVTVEGLTQEYPGRSGAPAFRALDGVSFSVPEGTTHGIVGESGSGKTTAMRAVVGLLRPTSGRITVAGDEVGALSGRGLRAFRAKVQLVYQNPFASLDPRQTVREIVEEPLLNFESLKKPERTRRVEEIVDRVALPPDLLGRRPQRCRADSGSASPSRAP
jgi:peptide/nickel transport system ATP-binding protein